MQLTSKTRGPRSKMPDPERLLTDYETHTAQELANMYQTSVGTIYRWIRDARETLRGITEGQRHEQTLQQ